MTSTVGEGDYLNCQKLHERDKETPEHMQPAQCQHQTRGTVSDRPEPCIQRSPTRQS